MSVAVLGLGLVLLRCGSSDSGGGPAGGSGGTSGGASGGASGHAGAAQAGATHAGSGNAGAGHAGESSGGGAGESEAGSAGASEAGAGGEGPGQGVAETLKYVFNKQSIPTTMGQFAADLNGDTVDDNQYAVVGATLAAQGVIPQATSDAETAAGRGLELSLLHVADSNLVKSAGAILDLARASEKASPDFGGTGMFTIDATAPSATLPGAIAGGVFTSKPVQVGEKPQKLSLRLPFGVAIDVPVYVFSVKTHVAENGFTTGQLNGAMLATDVDALVPPALATTLNATCAGVNSTSATCLAFLTTFDTDHNKTISADEVRANTLVKAVLGPDLKLFDALGKYAPSTAANAVKDSFSVGIGFTAVTAVFAE